MKQVKLSDANPNAATALHREAHGVPVKKISVGLVLGDTLRVFVANWLSFCLIAILAFVPMVAWVLFDTGSIQLLKGDVSQFSWGTFVLVWLGSMIFRQLADAAIITGAVETLAGNKARLSACCKLDFPGWFQSFLLPFSCRF